MIAHQRMGQVEEGMYVRWCADSVDSVVVGGGGSGRVDVTWG